MYISKRRLSATRHESRFQVERSVFVTSFGALRVLSIAARTLQSRAKVLSDEVQDEIVTASGVVQCLRRTKSMLVGKTESFDEVVVCHGMDAGLLC